MGSKPGALMEVDLPEELEARDFGRVGMERDGHAHCAVLILE